VRASEHVKFIEFNDERMTHFQLRSKVCLSLNATSSLYLLFIAHTQHTAKRHERKHRGEERGYEEYV
jgi:hypothetical protein